MIIINNHNFIIFVIEKGIALLIYFWQNYVILSRYRSIENNIINCSDQRRK
jgi:hypothetical protein